MRVYVRHFRAAYPSANCSKGGRRWCMRHGIEWRDFLHDGLDAEVLIKTGDPMALQVVKAAELEAAMATTQMSSAGMETIDSSDAEYVEISV